jgi:hypothetical protein
MRMAPYARCLAAVLLAAALAGCAPPEPAAEGASAPAAGGVFVPSGTGTVGAITDSVATSPGTYHREPREMVVMDSANPGADGPESSRQPNDCRYVGSRREARYAAPFDSVVMKNGVPFRCRMRKDGPQVRLVLSGDGGVPMEVRIHLPAHSARPLQAFGLENDQRAYEGANLLVGEDLDGDGWMDLRVRTYSGSGGVMYDVFRYRPATRRFVQDTMLSGSMNVHRIAGRPCTRTSSKTSADDIESFDYCWSRGAWVLTRTDKQERFGSGRILETVRERRGGRMQVVRVDTFP